MIKKFLCWLGWHSTSFSGLKYSNYFRGMPTKVQCKWCGHVMTGMDSQGNVY